eukprot:TRINITY_DN133_c0_g1_i1.p1 TRINITY_DN133_c0_g1~~TRINITY_DN133_c0_g1_i1.p1  ORF type:complete len:200 (-),score=45.31 TRINITY_DN133_c0_g1_i1:42-641(-)
MKISSACLFLLGMMAMVMANMKTDNSFDYFVFVQEYTSVNSTSFTIHGLWPQRNDGSYPSYCPGQAWNENDIKSLLPVMDEVWVSDDGPNSDFWSHEWTKHGTCSTLKEEAFFQTAISLYPKFNIMESLREAKITPNGNTYTKTQVESAVEKGTGFQPTLHCNTTSLLEVAMCISKSYSAMNCPSDTGDYFVCPDSFTF